MKVPVVKEILRANDEVAQANRRAFDAAGATVVNLMASPGAGKTSLILATRERMEGLRLGVIEGDVAGTLDADLMAERGIPVVQINTGGSCHLDAPMVRAALPHLDLEALDLIFIENVGNLICPASYRLGAHLQVVVGSVPEGDDKPYKYPAMFAGADAVVLNKDDLAGVFRFRHAEYERGIRMLNPDAPLFRASCWTGEGLEAWIAWMGERAAKKEAVGAAG